MPAVVVAAAVYGGYALVAVEGLSTFATIAAIGAVTAGVGAVTGNKDLMRVGEVMGLVGGVGALAQSAGVLGTEAATPGAAEQLSGPPPEAATESQGAVAKSAMPDTAPDVAKDVASDVATTTGATARGAAVTQVGAPAAGATLEPEQLSGPPPDTAAAPPPSPDSDFMKVVKPFFDKTGEFIKNNQLFSYGLMQVGGAAMQGLFDPTKEAQVQLMNANAKLAEQRAANIAAGVPTGVVTGPRPNVFGNATAPTYTAPRIGLINAPVTPVTGKPA